MINDYFKIFFGSYGDSAILLKKDDFTIVDFNSNRKGFSKYKNKTNQRGYYVN